MSDAWYYAEAEKAVGPISIRELKRVLHRLKYWKEVFVWHSSFDEWRKAGTVPDLDFAVPRTAPPISKELKGNTKKKRLWIALSFVIALISFAAVGAITKNVLNTYYQPANAVIDETLIEMVNQLKSTLPRKVDDVTTLVDVRRVGKQVTYFYEIDPGGRQIPSTFISAVRRVTVPKVCGSKLKDGVVNNGITYVYRYKSAAGSDLGQFIVAASDCT